MMVSCSFWRVRAITAAVVAAPALIAGCSDSPSVVLPPESPVSPYLSTSIGAARVNGAVISAADENKLVEPPSARQGGRTVGTPIRSAAAQKAPSGDLTVNFIDTDIREIVRVVLGDLLHKNYTIDPGVQGQTTIQTGRPVGVDELLPLLETVLEQSGAVLVRTGDTFRVMPSNSPEASAPVILGAAPGFASEIMPLRYASAKQLAKLLEPYVPDGAKMLAEEGHNVIVISGSSSVRRTLGDLVHVFDVDFLAGQSYALLPVRKGDPTKVATELQHLFQAEGDGVLSGVVRIFPIDQAGAVMVTSQQQKYLDEATRFVADLDRVSTGAGRTMHVYYVQNGLANEIEAVLRRAFTPQSAPSEAGPGEVAPGAAQGEFSESGFNQNGGGAGGGAGGAGSAGGSGGLGSSGVGGATGANATAPGGGLGQTGAGGQTAAGGGATGGGPAENLSPLGEGEAGGAGSANSLRIIANAKNNSLLIFATEREFTEVEATLRKIDVLPQQVLIEATIAEITLNHELRYGTQYFFKNGGVNIRLTAGADGGILPSFPGFSVSSSSFAIQALSQITDTKVLSSPQLMVLNNEKARLQVGNSVPIITGSSQSTLVAGSPVVNNVEYRDTGVILTLTPRINAGGMVTLDLEQEVSAVANALTTASINSPTFEERRVRSRVAVQDGETIGIAGLISDSTAENANGIPWLREIPILGFVFGTVDNTRVRTELIVLLTPHIVHDQRDARALTAELKRKLSPAQLVPLTEPPVSPITKTAPPNLL